MPLRFEVTACVGAGLARDAGTSVWRHTQVRLSQASQLPHKLARALCPFTGGLMNATHTFFKEKLQIQANIWYKVSRSERV